MDLSSDNPILNSWLRSYMKTDETEEVKKHLSTKLIRDLLIQGDFHKTNEAFKEVCLMMNSKNTPKRKKWNFLANDNPTMYNKGRSLLQKLKLEQSDMLDKQLEEDRKKTPGRLTRSSDKHVSTRAQTS